MLKKTTKLLLVFTLLSQIALPAIFASASVVASSPESREMDFSPDWSDEQLEVWSYLYQENRDVWLRATSLVWMVDDHDPLIEELNDLNDAFDEIVSLVNRDEVTFEDAVVLMVNNTMAFRNLSLRLGELLVLVDTEYGSCDDLWIDPWTDGDHALYEELHNRYWELHAEVNLLYYSLCAMIYCGPLMIVAEDSEQYLLINAFRDEFVTAGPSMFPLFDGTLPFDEDDNVVALASMNEIIERLEYLGSRFSAFLEADLPFAWTSENRAIYTELQNSFWALFNEASRLRGDFWNGPAFITSRSSELYALYNQFENEFVAVGGPGMLPEANMNLPVNDVYNEAVFAEINDMIARLEPIVAGFTAFLENR